METFLDKPTVRIVAGPHAGREGTVTSIPWLGNLWHCWMEVNVAATTDEIRQRYSESVAEVFVPKVELGTGPREWLTVYRSQVEFR